MLGYYSDVIVEFCHFLYYKGYIMTKKKKKRKKRVKNGELTQLANGHWQGRVAVGRTENGPMYQTITRESKEELEALVLYQRLLYARNKLTQRSKMTLEEIKVS